MTASQPYAGYLFVSFAGEDTPDGEQVRFALSRGDDPLSYVDLAGNEPVLTWSAGRGGIRDPFVVRSPRDGRFFMIATDLKIYGTGDWDAAQRTGSRSIVVWESDDLVDWTPPRSVQVAPSNAGDAWAPEACWDEEHDEFFVFWASTLYDADDPAHERPSYHRMLCATTRDFVSFSEARVWSDPGHSVIDSTVVAHDGWWYRFTKDEREPSSSTPTSKFITVERSRDLRSDSYEPVTDGVGRAGAHGPGIEQGEGPVVVRSNAGDRWYLFIDEFGGRGYVPFESADLDASQWTMAHDARMPTGARHGSVLPVTRAEHAALLQAWGPGDAGCADSLSDLSDDPADDLREA
ncbi:glycoside hydrolase family 43 protein [Sanguibacter suarezii]|uniref:glycoside hydrolase family 43 protein n=1 Tax=Sanguibacter suarezii TaxID=60921 RepID=UPI000A8A4487|nr:glycoside hydrolase family 43 protein [Sanguibacter suarezii]